MVVSNAASLFSYHGKQGATLQSCLEWEGHRTTAGPGRLGWWDVQATMGKGKLPVMTGGRRLVYEAWLKPGQYKVTLPSAPGFWMWYEQPGGREKVGGRKFSAKLRLALGLHIRTHSWHFKDSQSETQNLVVKGLWEMVFTEVCHRTDVLKQELHTVSSKDFWLS